ncbi:MAG TPA: polysaccharide deacetylase family protein [Thermomicrobiales bacterium]|jgi:peptidoglycan/xylan/chitin deacetylase (PgdA/CDA1 family)
MSASKIELAAGALHWSHGAALLRRTPAWSGVLVLNYHRLGHGTTAPFFRDAFSATPDDFDRQLAFLARNADVIGADDLPHVLRRGRGRHVMITFDDGYLDNYELAFPLLRRHGLSATFFICTGLLDGRRLSWWDEIAWMLRTSTRRELPASTWLEAPVALAGDREDAIKAVIERYRAFPGEQTAGFLEHLGETAGTGRADPSLARNLWMTWDNVREMRTRGMAIGAHTITHPILSRLPAERQLEEIGGSGARLAVELGEAPCLFAYPVGKPYTFNADTRVALQACGFRYAFSFYGGHQPFAPVDRYDVRRAHVDWRTTFPLFQAKVTLPTVFARW